MPRKSEETTAATEEETMAVDQEPIDVDFAPDAPVIGVARPGHPYDPQGNNPNNPYEGKENPLITSQQRAAEMAAQPEGVFDSRVMYAANAGLTAPNVLPPLEPSGLTRPAPASPMHDDERAVNVPGVQAPDRAPPPDHGASRAELGGFAPVSPSEVTQANMFPVQAAGGKPENPDEAVTGIVNVADTVGETVDGDESAPDTSGLRPVDELPS